MSSGKLLTMVDGYTFHRNGAKRTGGIQWFCSHRARGCNVNIVLNEDAGELVRLSGEHNHEPPIYVKADFKFITLVNGKQLLMVNGFTYHKISREMYSGGFRWRCSTTQSKRGRCNAFVVLTCDAQTLLRISGHQHCHDPPVLKKTAQGTYIKV